MAAALNVFGLVFYAAFGSGSLQPWAGGEPPEPAGPPAGGLPGGPERGVGGGGETGRGC